MSRAAVLTRPAQWWAGSAAPAPALCTDPMSWQLDLQPVSIDLTRDGLAVITNVRCQHIGRCGGCKQTALWVYTDGGEIRHEIVGGDKRPRWRVVERAGAWPRWPETAPCCGRPFRPMQWSRASFDPTRWRPRYSAYEGEGSPIHYARTASAIDPEHVAYQHVVATVGAEQVRLANEARRREPSTPTRRSVSIF